MSKTFRDLLTTVRAPMPKPNQVHKSRHKTLPRKQKHRNKGDE